MPVRLEGDWIVFTCETYTCGHEHWHKPYQGERLPPPMPPGWHVTTGVQTQEVKVGCPEHAKAGD